MPLVVHFKRPAGWQATINIHYWNTAPADPATTWPGVAMTAEASDWFVYQFPIAEAASIVFNDGAGRQTGDLRRESDGWFYTNNTWYALNPERPAIPVIRATPHARLYDRLQTVTLESENTDDVIWYTTDGSEPWDRSANAATAAAVRYQAPFIVAQTTTITAVGVNSAARWADPHVRLYHRSECRSATTGGGGEPSQRHLRAADRSRVHAHRQPAGAAGRLLHARRQRANHRFADLCAGQRRGRARRPDAADRRGDHGAVPDHRRCRQRDAAKLLLQRRPGPAAGRLPRGDDLLRHHHPLLRR